VPCLPDAVDPSRLLLPALSLTLLLSWGSLYYAFAMLAGPIQAEMNWSAAATMGGYSTALLAWGVCAYPVGRWVDRHGGRRAMTFGSCLCAVLFLVLSRTQSLGAFYLVWAGLGAGMALTLYEPAFAVVVQAWPVGYRRRIGLLTLAGGLASTAFWPLTFALEHRLGWRTTVLVYAALHLFVCAPLHAFALPALRRSRLMAARTEAHRSPAPQTTMHMLARHPAFWLLVLSFTALGFVTSAMATHVVPMLVTGGATTASALATAALIGPMQVAGRSAELLLAGRLRPRVVGWITVALIPLALAALWAAPWAMPDTPALLFMFALAYGAGLGLTTIVRATTPAELFGAQAFAAVSGALSGPAVLARATGPLAATLMLGHLHSYHAVLLVLLVCALAGAAAYVCATRKPGP
jgi:MFS family permease